MNAFTYPVLTDSDSSYVEGCSFSLKYWDNQISSEKITFFFDCHLSSTMLSRLIDENKAIVILSVTTSILRKAKEISLNEEKGKIEIDFQLPLIQDNEDFSFVAYIVSKEDQFIPWTEEFIAFYPKNVGYFVKKNDILAISNSEAIIYSSTANDFFKLRTVENQNGSGVKFGCTQENVIEIKVGSDFSKHYSMIKGNKAVRNLINAHLVFEALLYVILKIRAEDPNTNGFRSKEWFISLRRLCEASDIDLEVDLLNGDDDIDSMFSLIQKITNNQLEESLVNFSEPKE